MKFRHLIKRSLIDRDGQIIISNLDFVFAINCTLAFQLSDQDAGITLKEKNQLDFVCQFSRKSYNGMLDIIDRIEDGFNWLYDPHKEDEIALLLSVRGEW